MKRAFCGLGFLVAATLIGCGGGGGGGSVPSVPNGGSTPTPAPTPHGQKIAHIVIVIQENRSFDNLFATYPGADGAQYGTLHTGKQFKLTKAPLVVKDINHMRSGYLTEYDNGKMDGFDQIGFGATGGGGPAGTYPLRYVDPSQIQPYWAMAKNYALADHMFSTQGSGSFTGHQDLIAGGTGISPTKTLVDSPSQGPWGCDAPTGTKTSYLNPSGDYFFNKGPFPCLTYKTLATLLDAKSLSWKYYVPSIQMGSTGFIWTAFDAIHDVRYGSDWKNVVTPETNVLNDISADKLPAVSWVIPNAANSDHAAGNDTGPQWVASIVNAIGASSAWSSTVVIVVWDDWGGWYDHEPPPILDKAGGLGFRVPMLAISPYAKSVGYISHTQYEFGSILRFVEDNWNLGRIGTTDVRATSIADMFDFSISPRPFKQVPSTLRPEFFQHQQKRSLDPPDDE
jgi:phospholipase C